MYGIVAFCVMVAINGIHSTHDQYCIKERFNAQCADGEVILMTYATYGRMRVGKCIKYNLNIGCYVDILPIADSRCSGRESCEFGLLEDQFLQLEPCEITELEAYMEATYICVKVPKQTDCLIQPSNSNTGLNYVSKDSSLCISEQKPLNINAAPGQRIEIVLLDFSSNDESRNGNSCTPIGFINEQVTRSNITICVGSSSRVSIIYRSVSSEINIRFLHESSKGHHNYLIGYEFLGCSDPELHPDAWYTRDADNANIGCKTTNMKWTLQCVNNEWIGNFENCSDSGHRNESPSEKDAHDSDSAILPENTIVVIVISVSVLISSIVLILGVVYAYKSRQDTPAKMNTGTLPLTKDAIYSHNKHYPTHYDGNHCTTMPIYNGSTYKPIQHASTCKRNRESSQNFGPHYGIYETSFRSEGTPCKYESPRRQIDFHMDTDPFDAEYEAPYETRVRKSHK